MWGTDTIWQKDANGVFLSNNDHLYTTDVLTNSSNGNKSWAGVRESFGKTTVISGAAMTYLMRFPGQWEDGAIKFFDNFQRYYYGESGRFLSVDPWGIHGGRNFYAAVSASPTNNIDNYALADWDPDRWKKYRSMPFAWANCYGYAMDKVWDKNPGNYWLWPLPTCSGLIAGAKEEGMVDPVDNWFPCGGECPKGYYKVQVFLDDQTYHDRDYHWYRQDSDGGWSHKRGVGGAPTRNDSDNQPLVCPANQSRSYEDGRAYGKFCATLCAPG